MIPALFSQMCALLYFILICFLPGNFNASGPYVYFNCLPSVVLTVVGDVVDGHFCLFVTCFSKQVSSAFGIFLYLLLLLIIAITYGLVFVYGYINHNVLVFSLRSFHWQSYQLCGFTRSLWSQPLTCKKIWAKYTKPKACCHLSELAVNYR